MQDNYGLIVMLPLFDGEALGWWRIEQGAIAARGQDADPFGASGFDPSAPDARIMALVPTAATTVNWRDFSGLKPAQAITAACVEQRRASIDAKTVHCAAAVDAVLASESAVLPVLCATIDAGRLAEALTRLQSLGLDPDQIVPAGLILPAPASGLTEGLIGTDVALRARRAVLPDEPSLRALIGGDQPVVRLTPDEIDTALLATFADPPLNLRTGAFAPARPRIAVSPRDWRLIGALVLALLLTTLAIALVYLVKYNNGVSRYDAMARAKLQQVLPGESDPSNGEARLDARLAASAQGARSFSASAAVLFDAVKATPAASLRSFNRTADGGIAATVVAPDAAQLQSVVSALQRSGYKVGGQARTDKDGQAIDLMMKAP
jgi:general secretion pathway protein L